MAIFLRQDENNNNSNNNGDEQKKLTKVKKSIASVVVIQWQQHTDTYTHRYRSEKKKLWLLSSLACISIR